MSLTILLVDDHEVVRAGLRALIAEQADLQLVGEASNADEGRQRVRELQPDIVVMDVGLPDGNGVELTRMVRKECPQTRVLGLSIHDDRRFVVGMLNAGANGYVTKDCALAELISAIRAVSAGKTYLSPSIAGGVLEEFRRAGDGGAHADRCPLSPRERDVARLVAEGMTTREVAAELHVSPRTVETHRRNIMEKLSLKGVAELTRYAIREGLATLT